MSYPHTYIKLTQEERKEMDFWLKKLAVKQDWRGRKRLSAIRLSDEGQTIDYIALRVNASECSVRRWFARYRKKGIKGLVKP